MDKEDWIWVALGIFGIYLIVLAIIALPRFFSSTYVAWHVRGSGWPFLGGKRFCVTAAEVQKGLENQKASPSFATVMAA
jgi:hypothetical protein